MSTPVTAAVVIYNTSCEESATCQALAAISRRDLSVLIFDNSTSDHGVAESCARRGWTYLGGRGNLGISRAYNACVDHLKSQGRTGYLCLLDDDTRLDETYFQRLEAAAEISGSPILVPLIYSADALLSPCLLDENHRVRRFPDAQAALTYHGDQLSAINSGMAVRLDVFDDYRYDEHIFLDGVDHHFMLDMRKKGIGGSVFDYRCNHEFSGDSRPSRDSAVNRFRIYARDYAYILRDRKLAFYGLVGKRALSLTLGYRSPVFLKILFQTPSR